jgi:hypothetical protein
VIISEEEAEKEFGLKLGKFGLKQKGKRGC